jgi:hypothetical protein
MKRIRYKQGYKYQLTLTYTIETDIRPLENIETDWVCLARSGLLIVRKGYAWDGATGAHDTADFMRGSLVHDGLYQLMDLGLLDLSHRRAADQLLRRICREDGMSRIRAWWVYHTVRRLGGLFAGKENGDNRERVAP